MVDGGKQEDKTGSEMERLSKVSFQGEKTRWTMSHSCGLLAACSDGPLPVVQLVRRAPLPPWSLDPSVCCLRAAGVEETDEGEEKLRMDRTAGERKRRGVNESDIKDLLSGG